MSLMQIALANTKELESVPAAEYTYEVANCIARETKAKDRNMIVATLLITNPPRKISHPAPVMEFFVLPNANDWEENEEMSHGFVRRLRRFLECSKVPFGSDGFDPAQAVGAKGKTFFDLTEDDDGEIRNHPRWPKFTNK